MKAKTNPWKGKTASKVRVGSIFWLCDSLIVVKQIEDEAVLGIVIANDDGSTDGIGESAAANLHTDPVAVCPFDIFELADHIRELHDTPAKRRAKR